MGRVVETAGIAEKRSRPSGRVEVTGGAAKECPGAKRRVILASRKGLK